MGTWGILGDMELARQELRDRYPQGMTKRELMELVGLTSAQFETFIMQMTRYAFISEYQAPRTTIRYFIDPEVDDHFERRILPYDRGEPYNE